MRKDLVTLDKIYTKVRKYLTLNWISKQIHKKWNNIVLAFLNVHRQDRILMEDEVIFRGNSK